MSTRTVDQRETVKPRKKGRSPRDMRNLRTGLLFVSPWVVGVLVFVVYPLIYSFAISLTEYSGMADPTFIGFQNYVTAALDPLVHTAVGNTLYFMVFAIPL
ncbi:MAG: sugar ABC transporter permease, partial [Brachybacterium sp.]|nr:sugar ABC transporter permease [Brachybacterium sp.]